MYHRDTAVDGVPLGRVVWVLVFRGKRSNSGMGIGTKYIGRYL